MSEKKLLSESVKQAFDASGGDVVRASQMLAEMATQNQELYLLLTESYLKQACYDSVRKHCQSVRARIWNAPNYEQSGKNSKVRALRHANMLMDLPLPNGKRIGDATKADLLDAADAYNKQASKMTAEAAWWRMIATRINGKQMVKNVLTEKHLRALKEKAAPELKVANA